MQSRQFETHLQQMIDRIETLPESQRGPLMNLVDETRQRHKDIRDAARKGHDALDDWRLIQKYRIFDAEARQREAGSHTQQPDDESDA